MNILFVSAWFPFPPINGAKIRIYNLIRELAKYHDISLLSFTRVIPINDAISSFEYLKKYCQPIGVIPWKIYKRNSLSAIRGLFSDLPSSVFYSYDKSMLMNIEHTIKSNHFDLIIGSEAGPPSIVSYLVSRTRAIPKVIDAIEIGILKDAYYKQNLAVKRLRSGLTWFKLKNFTGRILKNASAITVPSLIEKENLETILPGHIPIEVIPHSLDLDHYLGDFGEVQPNLISFMGSLTYEPNFDAVNYLLNDMYPHIKSGIDDVKLQIIGNTAGFEKKLQIEGSVKFTGLVSDIRPPIAQSWLSVVPLRIGAGTRLKVIESMALGTPVVSTSKGAEGLDVVNGKNILISDEPNEFADNVIKVIKNPGLRKELSIEGLKLVKEKYSSVVIGQRYNSFLNTIIPRK